MRRSLIIKRATQLDVGTSRFQVKGSFTVAPKWRTRVPAYYIELPRKSWDRIVLFMFSCCLFVFLHALFGFGLVDEDLDVSNDTPVHPCTPLSGSLPCDRNSVASNEDQKIREPRMTRMLVDWDGNYDLFPSTAPVLVSPAVIPQDAFPDPTPVLVVPEQGRVLGESSPFMTTKVRPPVDIPSTFYGTPYDPFQLVFEDSVDTGEQYGLYLATGPPRTARQSARQRRFGSRCYPDAACL